MSLAVRIRTAIDLDVPAMHRIRLAVRENQLSDPGRITEDDYLRFVAAQSAWVAETGDIVVGFAAVDAPATTVWALFVDPTAEGHGIGKTLHDHMIQWSRDQRLPALSLTTGADTRADRFYRKLGWEEVGRGDDGEVCLRRFL